MKLLLKIKSISAKRSYPKRSAEGIRFYLFLCATLMACNNQDENIRGTWIIDKAYYHDQPIIYNLLTNAFELSKDHSCFLPALHINERHTNIEKGIWNVYKKNDTLYLQIKSTNIFFNRTFKISNYRNVTDSVSFGTLTKATMSSDSLKLECTNFRIIDDSTSR